MTQLEGNVQGLRAIAPRAVVDPPDICWETFDHLLQFLLDATGQDANPSAVVPYNAAGKITKEAQFKQAIRATGYRGLSNLDIDLVFGDKAGNAKLAVSFKCGGEAPSSGWHKRMQITALNIPVIEIRQVDGDLRPEDSRYEGTWLTSYAN